MLVAMSTVGSVRLRLLQLVIDGLGGLGHASNVVVFAHARGPGPSKRRRTSRVVPQFKQTISQRVGVVCLHDQPATGPFDDLRKCAATRLDDRHTARHRLEQEDALRVLIRRRHRQDVEAVQERDLVRAIDLATILELILEPPLAHTAANAIEILAVLGCEVPGRPQPGGPDVRPRWQLAIRLAERVQALLWRDAREESDRERAAAISRLWGVAIEVDAQRYQAHLVTRDPEIPGHVVHVVLTDGNEEIHVPAGFSDQVTRLL